MRMQKSALNTLILSILIILGALALTLVGQGMRFSFGAEATMQYMPLFWAILAAVGVSFVFGFVRYSLAGAITLASAVLHDQLLSLALCAIISLAFGLSSYLPALLMAGLVATYVFTIPQIRTARVLVRGGSNRGLARDEAAAESRNQHRPLKMVVALAALLILAAFIISGNKHMIGAVLPLFTGLLSAVVSSCLITPFIWAALASRKMNRK